MATVTAATARPVRVGYDEDFAAWLDEQAALLRAGRTDALDLANLAEEIEDMGKSEKRAVSQNLIVVFVHLLKHVHQPERRGKSWRRSIREHRRRLNEAFEYSPSLRRHAEFVFAACYKSARKQAADATGLHLSEFPEVCPFTLAQALDEDFLP
jgi:hypothetical protein